MLTRSFVISSRTDAAVEFAFLAGTEQLGQLKLPNDLLQDIVEARRTSATQFRAPAKSLQLRRVVIVEVKQMLY